MTQQKMYHNSPHLFEMPSYDKCVANRQHHDNGNLGLWFSTSNDWQKGFGTYTYEFEVNGKPKLVAYGDFYKMCMKAGDGDHTYTEIREAWLADSYTHVLIQENTGSTDMGIVLDFDSIKNFTLLSA